MKYLRISRHGKVRGGILDDEDEVDNEFKLSPSTEEDEFAAAAQDPRNPAAASAAGGQIASGSKSSWRFGGARRKRLSLPSIRLYSSLDSPGAYYGDQLPQLGTGSATQTTQDATKNTGGPGKLKGPVHQALAARRSREFNRADTDFLPSVMLEDDEEDCS